MGARRIAVAALASIALAAHAAPLAAHPLAPALLEIREQPDGNADVRWKLPAAVAPGARLAPELPATCTTLSPPRLAEANALGATMMWRIHCDAPLAGARLGVAGLDVAGTQALLRLILADGVVVQRVLTARASSFNVPSTPDGLQVALDYVVLGVEHIATGADHLLFVLGLLLLLPAARALALAITGFTLGHSITLSLAVLGYASLPQGAVEVCIALSVFALAVELTRKNPNTALRRFPWIAAACFGLLHGLGFAGALREVGLPAGEVPLALLSFNGGIELGQLAFVGAAGVTTLALTRLPIRLPAWAPRVPVYAMGSLAAFWSIQRAAALWP